MEYTPIRAVKLEHTLQVTKDLKEFSGQRVEIYKIHYLC